METRASYVLVGAFVLGLVAVLTGIGLWVARTEFAETSDRYVIYFDEDVTGLGIGSPVRFRGIPVGTVSTIEIDPSDVQRVRVTVALNHGTPVKEDTVAMLALQGITGVAFVQLTGGTQESAMLTVHPGAKLPVIKSQFSTLYLVMQRLPQAIEKIVVITERATKLFEDKNLNAISATLQSLRQTMDTLGSKDGDLRRLLAESRVAVEALRQAAVSATSLAGKVEKQVDPLADSTKKAVSDVRVTLRDIRAATGTANRLLSDLESVIGENKAPLKDFAQSGLYEFSLFISEARVLVDSLTRLTNRIERDPGHFLFGDAQQGVSAP